MLQLTNTADAIVLTGEVIGVRYHDQTSGFFVARMRVGANEIAVIGNTMFLAPGARIVVSGQWVDDARWGRQFKAGSVALADQESAMQTLLGSGFLKGVKTKMAQQIARAFGPETFARLDQAIDQPDSLRCVKGIGPVNSRWIVESWQAQRHWAQAALVSVRAGLTMRQAKEAYRRFGQELTTVINDNPYLLTVLHGVSWQRADEIARLEWPGKQKIDHDDPRRYAAAVREALRKAYTDGHMALVEADALAKARELARPTLDGFEDKARSRYADKHEHLLLQGDWLYLQPYYEIERDTAWVIAQMIAQPAAPIGDWEQILANLGRYSSFTLSPDQLAAVQSALTHRLLVITGGPGTGKTSCLRTICNILAAHGLSLTLCAPTGKAARRMAEATDMEAATIHRTLGIYGDGERRYSFQTDAVLVDESSMIDAALMRQVVVACNERTRLILIGDVDQLPPVGAGEPFYQVIQSGAPVVRLSTVHRQGRDSGIIWAAHAFNIGIVPDVTPFDDIEIGYVASNAMLPNTVLKQVSRLVADGLTIQQVQVLTPLNQHEWGQHALNLRLQETYNPGPFPLRGCAVKADDKVIHTKNVYDMREQTVLNGMTGVVQWVASDEDERIMDARRKEEGDDELPVILRVRFDGESEDTTYTREELVYLKLAYAMTVHKCVHPDTLVEVGGGLVPIKDVVEESGKIGTPNGVRTYRSLVRNPIGPALSIQVEGGYSITVTPDHGLDVWTGEQYERRDARDIRTGDLVRSLIGPGLDASDLVPLPNGGDRNNGHEERYRVPSLCDKDVAEFLGMMVADGTVYHSGFRLLKRHKDVVDRFAYLCASLFGIESKVTACVNAFCCTVNSVYLAKWLESIGGLSPNNKDVPDVILRSSTRVQAAFLRGLFEDGAVNIRHGRFDHVEWFAKSEKLGSVVQTLLLRCGIAANRVRASNRDGFMLAIYGGWAAEFARKIGFVAKAKNERLALAKGHGDKSEHVPLSDSEARQLRSEFRQIIGRSSANNAVFRRYVTRNTLQQVFVSGIESDVVAVLRDRCRYLHMKVELITETACESMCLEVPHGHQFLQNGFCGWNSQGSEYSHVVLAIPGTHQGFMLRQLAYTGLTRAKKYCAVVSAQSALQAYVQNEERVRRITFLADMIRNLVPVPQGAYGVAPAAQAVEF